jgi:uncharacterized protein (DUF1697 family)
MSVAGFIRGINVGGSTQLAMADLRAIAASCGYGDPRTYLQSGNIVVDTDDSPETVASRLEAAIAHATSIGPAVVARSDAQLRSVVAANPYLDRTDDPKQLHVMFHREPVRRLELDAEAFLPEETSSRGRELFLYLPGGLGRSRLVQALDKRRPLPIVTTRNWRTVLAVTDLL